MSRWELAWVILGVGVGGDCTKMVTLHRLGHTLGLPALDWEPPGDFGGAAWKGQVWWGEGPLQGTVHPPKQLFLPGEVISVTWRSAESPGNILLEIKNPVECTGWYLSLPGLRSKQSGWLLQDFNIYVRKHKLIPIAQPILLQELCPIAVVATYWLMTVTSLVMIISPKTRNWIN